MSEKAEIIRREFFRQQIGKTLSVIFEAQDEDGYMTGHTANYIPVKAKLPIELQGEIVDVMITGVGDGTGGGNDLVGILFGLGAAAFYATVILLNKFIKQVGGIHRTFLQFLAAILILLPYVLLTGGVQIGSLNGIGWGSLLVVGLIHTGVTYCLYFTSLKELPGQKAAILSYIDPLVAVLMSVTVLGEKMTLWQVIGGSLILGFTLWNELPHKKAVAEQTTEHATEKE
jgi:threonine/homoserine efflux transporter RhtA